MSYFVIRYCAPDMYVPPNFSPTVHGALAHKRDAHRFPTKRSAEKWIMGRQRFHRNPYLTIEEVT